MTRISLVATALLLAIGWLGCGGDECTVTDMTTINVDMSPNGFCGFRRCAYNQVCIIPCCKISLPDAGEIDCPASVGAPYCLDLPFACTQGPSCSCGFRIPTECNVSDCGAADVSNNTIKCGCGI